MFLCRRATALGALANGCSRAAAFSSATSITQPKQTCLYDFHLDHGAKMVDFAGWNMPIQYADQSIIESCRHTRTHCSLFDVSHMLQSNVRGKDRIAFMESLCVADIAALDADFGTLTLFTNENGGIEDDLIVTRTSGDHLYVVTNAGRAAEDSKLMQDAAAAWRDRGKDVTVEHIEDRGLVALQGPFAADVLQNGVGDSLDKLYFMHSVITKVFGVEDCRITRCGYTGEDGFEISVPSRDAAALSVHLMSLSLGGGQCRLAGLGARDVLRLEAGLCLYGSDIDDTTTPVEATLLWTVAKSRRQMANFPGAERILGQVKNRSVVKRKRVGMISESGRPPRGGATLHHPSTSEQVGTVTSGSPAPNLPSRTSVAMGYVQPKFAAVGTELIARQSGGGRHVDTAVKVSRMPFVPTGYYIKRK